MEDKADDPSIRDVVEKQRSFAKSWQDLDPETLLPEQYFDRMRRDSNLSGERRLMLAVLEDAVECFQKYAGKPEKGARRIFTEAAAWIDSSDRSWPYSFEPICDALDLDAAYLRGGLEKWRKRPRPKDWVSGIRNRRRIAGTRHRINARKRCEAKDTTTKEVPVETQPPNDEGP